jgi:hypothetical protein
MNTKNTLPIYGLNNSIAYCEAKGISEIFSAYAEHATGEEIMQIGFNQYTGYVYISLENGVQIASAFGQKVQYIVDNYETGESSFFKTYSKAIAKIETLNA